MFLAIIKILLILLLVIFIKLSIVFSFNYYLKWSIDNNKKILHPAILESYKVVNFWKEYYIIKLSS